MSSKSTIPSASESLWDAEHPTSLGISFNGVSSQLSFRSSIPSLSSSSSSVLSLHPSLSQSSEPPASQFGVPRGHWSTVLFIPSLSISVSIPSGTPSLS